MDKIKNINVRSVGKRKGENRCQVVSFYCLQIGIKKHPEFEKTKKEKKRTLELIDKR